MSDPIEAAQLDTCGCCEAAAPEGEHTNPPGLEAVAYRIGTWPEFFERLKARIHRQEIPAGDNVGQRPLAALTTRAADDPAIALMDAWSVVGDVLTFYQERIANEAFLRTATERRSVLELARSIGYELRPGVAAETWLAFTVDDAPGSPTEAEVPADTQVQSLPAAQGELPQTFETSDGLQARVAWNELRPQLRRVQTLETDVSRVYLAGTVTVLEPGDVALIVLSDGTQVSREVIGVEVESEAERTRVDLAPLSEPEKAARRIFSSFGFEIDTLADRLSLAVDLIEPFLGVKPQALLDPERLKASKSKLALTRENVDLRIFQKVWNENELQAFLTQHDWEEASVLAYVGDLLAVDLANTGGELFAFHETLSFFGHNAPAYKSLPADVRIKEFKFSGAGDDPPGVLLEGEDPAFPHNWDAGSGWEIWEDSLTNADYVPADVYLEREVDDLVAGTWAVFERSGGTRETFRVQRVDAGSRAGFGLSSKVTGLELEKPDGAALQAADKHSDFKIRNSVAHVGSEELELTTLPVTDELKAETRNIVLDRMVLGLTEGSPVALTGTEVASDGRVRHEVLILAEVLHVRGRTVLELTEGLVYSYLRDTVKLNANVVAANHGETAAGEVLGSGDGAAVNQRFELKKPPLTHVSAGTASGARSTLSLRVDGVEWRQEPSLYGLDESSRSYTVRIDDDAVPAVIFGDGKSGARLPTGQENVAATYRSGIGSEGEVGAGSLTLLKTRPFGIRGVVNPTAASGAGDPEKLADARDNAPLTVLTLDRIVSLKDYEDFARGFAGIGKAQARAVWDGEAERVHLTVADEDGDEVVSPLYENLLDAIEAARDPLREVVLDSYQSFVFFVTAKVKIEEAYLWDDVRGAIETALREAFAFERRGFAQPVTAAEVLQVIHGEAGVVAVDLDELYKTRPDEIPPGNLFNAVLTAQAARYDKDSDEILPAQLLLIHPQGIALEEMQP